MARGARGSVPGGPASSPGGGRDRPAGTEFAGSWPSDQCGGGPCCSSLPPRSAASPRPGERGGQARGLTLALGMNDCAGCWAGPLRSPRPLLPPPWRPRALRMSPSRLPMQQDSLLAEDWGAGELLPSPSPSGYSPFPTRGSLPIPPPFRVSQSWGDRT